MLHIASRCIEITLMKSGTLYDLSVERKFTPSLNVVLPQFDFFGCRISELFRGKSNMFSLNCDTLARLCRYVIYF